MKFFRNLAMGIWMYFDLIHIYANKKNIHKYREEGNLEAERKEIAIAESTWGKNLIRKVGVNVYAQGIENVPEGAAVFVANHQSYADISVLTSVIDFKQIGFIAKEDLRKLPLFGEWIYDVRSVFIKREDPRASLRAIEIGVEYLKQGFSMGIFPEGTRSKGGKMGEFKRGSLRLATKPGVPVVPITISGSYKCFEEKGYASPAEVHVYIHPAIETKDMDKKEAGELSERVREVIEEKLKEFQKI